MKLFENSENEIQRQDVEPKMETVFDQEGYTKIQEFCIENAIQLNKDQIESLKEIFVSEQEVQQEEEVEEGTAPSSDNSAIKDEEFKTEENSRGDDPTIDAAKGDSTQTGGEPCPCHIEDEIEKQQKNDEFVNDYDEDVKKNESTDISDNKYVSMLETCVKTGVQMNEDQLEAFKEEFLLEAKSESFKARKKFIDDIRKKVQKIFADEGIKLFLQETPNAKAFKNGESDSFNLRFDRDSKGMRIAAGILSGGQSELYRAFGSGTSNNRADQEALKDFIDDCEEDVAKAIEDAGKANGFDAELTRISMNGIKVKAVLNVSGIEANDKMKENKKAEREEKKEAKAAMKAEAKADKEARKAMK